MPAPLYSHRDRQPSVRSRSSLIETLFAGGLLTGIILLLRWIFSH